MNSRITKIFALAVTLIFFSFTATAQSTTDGILSKVKNTKNYNVFQLVSMDKELSTFANLVVLSGLATSMKLTDEITLFAPTNAAFDDMTIERYTYLTNPDNTVDLIKFIKHQILPKKHMKYDFKDNQVITTQGADEITVSTDGFDNVFISGSKIIKADIEASNGVIQIVNGVIDPNASLIGI